MPEGCARGQNERKRTGQIKLLDEVNVSKKTIIYIMRIELEAEKDSTV